MRKQIETSKIKQPCKQGKERNSNGRCVKIKTIKKTVPLEFVELSLSPDSNPVQILSFPVPVLKNDKINIPCKPGKEINSNGRCVKIKTVKNKKSKTRKLLSMKLSPCKPGKERNSNGRCVKIKTK